MKPPSDCPGLVPRQRRRIVAIILLLLGPALILCLRHRQDQPSVRPAVAGTSATAPANQTPPVSRPAAPPVVRTMVDMTPPPGAKSDYPLGVNAEPPAGKIILTTDKPGRLAFPSASAGGILPARVRLLELPAGKYRRLRIEEVWTNRDRAELIARHTMVGDHLLVSAADGVDAARIRAALPPGFAIRRALRSGGALLISFPVENDDSLPAARVALEKLGPALVKRVEPDTFVHTASIPNDPLFPEQWGLHNTGQDGGTPDADVDAPEAWDLRTDAAAFPIAVIDTGIDYTHPDLDANIWTNAGESGNDANGQDKRSNGVDDDSNGYVDDWRGWDFANDDSNPMDDNGHGTHVAGIIGAEGDNGEGIAGVCWSCRMMPLKALTSSGGGAWSDIIDAVAYAKSMKARVGNLSFGAYGAAPEEVKTAFAAANETLWCAAAGNGELPHNGNQTGDDLDEFHFFPACLDSGHLVSVTATARNDGLANFANYGRFTVDIAAPGVGIRSTLSDGAYGLSSGTSMACAYVAGFCALAHPLRVDPYPLEVRHLLLTTVKRSEVLRNKIVTRGRLDASLFLTQAKAKMDWQMFASGGAVSFPAGTSGPTALQIRPDGIVVAWGERALATGGPPDPDRQVISTPVEVPLPADARSVHVGSGECFAVLSDGALWTWTQGAAPHAVPITDVRFLVVRNGYSSKFVLRADGSLWSWGWEKDLLVRPVDVVPESEPGRVSFERPVVQFTEETFLDDAGFLYKSSLLEPVLIPEFPPLDRFTEMDDALQSGYGKKTVLAASRTGEAYGFGNANALGLSDDGTTTPPVRLPNWDGYLRAWEGFYATMQGGRVVSSKKIVFGEPLPNADGAEENSSPYDVGGVSYLVGISELGASVLTLTGFGKVSVFSRSSKFQLDEHLVQSHTQFQNIVGLESGSGGTMLLASDFRSLYFGNSLSTPPGVGIDARKTRPVEMTALRGTKHLSLGGLVGEVENYETHAIATMRDGLHIWGWLPVTAGDLNQPTGLHNNTLISAPAGFEIKETSWWGNFLIMEDGTLWHLPSQSSSEYVQIPLPSPAVFFLPGGSPVVQLRDGSVANHIGWGMDFKAITPLWGLKRDGTVWKHGAEGPVPGLIGITQIAGAFDPGESDLIALRDDGRVFMMGKAGAWPLLGDGVLNRELLETPALMEGLTGIVQVAAGFDHFVALRGDGQVFTWGRNTSGQLGVGDTLRRDYVEMPYGLSDVVQIWASATCTIAKRSDGTFWGWGGNKFGELCDGSATFEGAPTLAYGTSTTVFNAGNGFTDWLTTYFNEQDLRDVELFADVKDPDDDGLVNLVEYALGTNPRKRTVEFTYTDQPLPEPTLTLEYTKFVPSARLEKVRRNYYSNGVGIAGGGVPDAETTHLVMTVPRAERRSDVDYIVEVSDDLEHWHFGPGHTVEVLNTLTNLVVYDARPMEENRRRFIRLRLVRNNPGQTSIPR